MNKVKRLVKFIRDYYIIKKSVLFDEGYYFEQYLDIRQADICPIKHYLQNGYKEGRNPTKYFDTKYYLKKNPDVAESGINPFVHFIRHGMSENRQASIKQLQSGEKHFCKRVFDIRRNYWGSSEEARFLEELTGQRKDFKNNEKINPLVSIIMPTYNRAEFISGAINSVLNQRYGNFELIIVDDGSDDNTDCVVKKYKDNRINYFKINKSGVSKARNIGLSEAGGEYIFFLDSDNKWKENFLHTMIDYMLVNALDAAYSALAITKDFKLFGTYTGVEYDYASLLDQNYIDLNCFGYKKSNEKFFFDESIKRLVDWDFILSAVYLKRVGYAPFLGVEYYDGSDGKRITNVETLGKNLNETIISYIQNKHISNNFKIKYSRVNRFRLACLVHVYYIDLLPEILEKLKLLSEDFDLYIATSLDINEVENVLCYFNFKAQIFNFNNVGRDIGTFLYLLPTLQQYSLVLKLHTKRDLPGYGGALWREGLLKNLLYSSESILGLIACFKEDKDLLIAGPQDFYINDSLTYKELNQELRLKYIDLLKSNLDNDFGFFAGTMFWFNPNAFKAIEYLYKEISFNERISDNDAEEHVLERLLCAITNNIDLSKICLLKNSNLEIFKAPLKGRAISISKVLSGLDYTCGTTCIVENNPSKLNDKKINFLSNDNKSFFRECSDLNKPLRLAYVLWDFPALSQTFVINELRWLISKGVDVRVYFKIEPEIAAILDFVVAAEQVDSAESLAAALRRDRRNLCHSHFAYPAVTLLTHPACVEAGIHYTFMPHAVDIFHHENRKRNKIADISNHPLCLKVFVYGSHHRDFLVEAGVSADKIAYNMQAVDLESFQYEREQLPATLNEKPEHCRAIVIARFIEKKGIEYLIEAAAQLKGTNVVFELYGYGPLQAVYEEKIAALGVDNIRFTGIIDSPAALAQAYANSDIMLVPSVVAENGDMDGFPTVIMEAMAACIPVITTDVSAIPDYITDGVEALVIPQRDAAALAAAIFQLMAMSPARRQALVDNGKCFLARRTGTALSMRMLMDVWTGRSIDIFLVTFNTPVYENRAATFAIIRRVFEHTTTPYTLTIVDNNSAADFLDELEALIQGRDNVRLVRKQSNLFCGPASNLALTMAESEYAIYLCSKEGFVSGHGWERALIKAMDEHPAAALGGHLVHLPRFVYGREYCQHPEFSLFRNPNFARENPDRVFKHVQGGAFILRRSAFIAHGGFGEALPHNNMDVEYSYYLESVGQQLLEIPEVAAITVKTRPLVHSLIDENSAVVHPLTIESAHDLLDPVVKRQQVLCNICGWLGDEFTLAGTEPKAQRLCPQCGAGDTGRSFYRLLAADHRAHRRATLTMLMDDRGLQLALEKMFVVLNVGVDPRSSAKALMADSLSCVLVDARLLQDETRYWETILAALQIDGLLLIADERLTGTAQRAGGDVTACALQPLAEAAAGVCGSFRCEQVVLGSKQVGFDWRPLLKVVRFSADD